MNGATVRGAVLDGVVIGDGAYVGPGNELLKGLRVWPDTRLEATAVPVLDRRARRRIRTSGGSEHPVKVTQA